MTEKVGSFCIGVGMLLAVCASGAQRGRTPPPVLPPLTINEVMVLDTGTPAEAQGQFGGWVEIYNAGAQPIDLRDMYLTRDPGFAQVWRIPGPPEDPGLGEAPSSTVAPQGFLLVWLDGRTDAAGLHADFTLNPAGDALYLVAADGRTLIDGFAFGPQAAGVSYGRFPDGAGALRYFGFPTPLSPNNDAYLGEVGPLQFSHERGFYEAPFDLKIACSTPETRILCTYDGTPPQEPGPAYTGPIRIGGTVCLRAVATRPGWRPSAIYTQTYVFGAPAAVRSLPLVSLVGDPQNTFYEPNGVMAIVGGAYSGGVWTATGKDSYNNALNRDLERPVSAEWLFADDAGDSFQIDCGLRVHGSDYMRPRYVRRDDVWSGSSKFSLRLYFRDEYGADRLTYPLFERSAAEKFEHVVLRAGHNDQTNPFIKDELVRRLYQDMGNVSATGTFAHLYLNGQYKGYYNPTEHISAEACQEWFGSDQPWDVMTMSGIRDGDTRSWDSMISFATTHNLSAPANYQYLAGKLDIPAFIDYLIVRLWPNDWDWPQNNWSAAAERSEAGLWRFFVWDAEGTFESDQLNTVRLSELNSQGNANGQLYRALKANSDFRQAFNDRLFRHFYNGGALTEENVRRRFYELRDQLRSVIPGMNPYIVDEWTPKRQSIFLNACADEGLYTFAGPAFAVNGVRQWGGHAGVGSLLTMVPPTGTLAVFYPPEGIPPGGADFPSHPIEVTLLARDAPKRFLIPTGPDLGEWIKGRAYNDSTWTAATPGLPGGIGFEYDPSGALTPYLSTDIGSRMYGVNSSCYIRIPFTVAGDLNTLSGLTLHVQYDDGFVAFLNGVEVARRNFEGTLAWNSAASGTRDDANAVTFEAIDISASAVFLHSSNVLAIQALNASAGSPDFLLAAELTAQVTPTGQGLPAGAAYYTDPIPLTKSVRLRARALKGSTLSALSDVVFAVGPVAESLRISEIMYHPADTGRPDDPNGEYLELTNIGAAPINLNLVRFTKGIDFVFPDFELAPHGRCLVVRDRAAFVARYGPDLPVCGQYQGSLSNAGERLVLCDAAGMVIQDFTYRDDWFAITDGGGFSLTARDVNAADPSAWSRKDAWRPSAVAGGSPGTDDTGLVPTLGAVVISEIMADPAPSDLGGDWIELHNTTDRPVSIGGWFLSDDADDLTRYTIAPDTTIAPGGFLVLTAQEHFGNPSDPGCRRPFGLSANGETVYLHSGAEGALTGYSEQATFGPSASGVSFVRHALPTGDAAMVPARTPTPGQANAGPRTGPVVISEIMYHPDTSADAQYVELLNISDAPVTLYDAAPGVPWRLIDESQTAGVNFLLPSDPPVTLAPRQLLLLARDRATAVARYRLRPSLRVVEWTFGTLRDTGGRLVLARPGKMEGGVRQWIPVDAVAFSDGSHGSIFPGGVDPWPQQADGQGASLTRLRFDAYGNDANNWSADAPSPVNVTR